MGVKPPEKPPQKILGLHLLFWQTSITNSTITVRVDAASILDKLAEKPSFTIPSAVMMMMMMMRTIMLMIMFVFEFLSLYLILRNTEH